MFIDCEFSIVSQERKFVLGGSCENNIAISISVMRSKLTRPNCWSRFSGKSDPLDFGRRDSDKVVEAVWEVQNIRCRVGTDFPKFSDSLADRRKHPSLPEVGRLGRNDGMSCNQGVKVYHPDTIQITISKISRINIFPSVIISIQFQEISVGLIVNYSVINPNELSVGSYSLSLILYKFYLLKQLAPRNFLKLLYICKCRPLFPLSPSRKCHLRPPCKG